MSPVHLRVPHIKQKMEADCLAACAAMVLAYRQYHFPYQKIVDTLNVRWYGTPFSHLQKLQRLKVDVQVTNGTLASLYQHLANDNPIIVAVQAGELPYHNQATNHSVVVVGIDNSYVYVNDPMVESGMIPISKGDFGLAWLEHDERYAVLKSP